MNELSYLQKVKALLKVWFPKSLSNRLMLSINQFKLFSGSLAKNKKKKKLEEKTEGNEAKT